MRICPRCYGLYAEQNYCPKDGHATESYIDVLIGKQLGPYAVRSLIGEGGMGVVYAGEHTSLGKRVALKVLRPELSLRDDIVNRFVQEARAVGTIGHANIVNIYDFGRTPFGSFYFVMEHLDGQTIRVMLEKGGAQPLERVKLVVLGVGAALAAAHAKGFIHRDVKPENIMLVNRAGQEVIKLLDFGIVKLLGSDRKANTHTGDQGAGTPQYMCPEQLQDAPVDYRADIYGLGVVAYEMLTGAVPYPGKSPAEVRQLQLTRMPAPPSVCRTQSRISRALDAAVLWAISLDPAARPRRLEDFLSAFQTGYDRTLVEQTHPYQARSQWGRRFLIGGSLVVAAAAAGGGSLLVVRHLEGRQAGIASGSGAPPPPSRGSGTDDPLKPDPQRWTPKQVAESARQALREALESPNATTRALAAEFIGLSGRPVLLAELRKLLDDSTPVVIKEAAFALAALGDKEAIPHLRQNMKAALSFQKLHLAGALAQLGDEAGKATLRHELQKSTNLPTRALALDLLGKIGDRAALSGLRQRLQSVFLEDTKRRSTLGFLAAAGDEEAREQLHSMLSHGEWLTRVAAAKALGESDERGRTILLKALETTGPARFEAALALAQFGDDHGQDILLESIRSSDEMGRRSAALALGRLPPKLRVMEALVRARTDRSPTVTLAAMAALAVP